MGRLLTTQPYPVDTPVMADGRWLGPTRISRLPPALMRTSPTMVGAPSTPLVAAVPSYRIQR
jgi:hypothetical protein